MSESPFNSTSAPMFPFNTPNWQPSPVGASCLRCGGSALDECLLTGAGPSVRKVSWRCHNCGWMNSFKAQTYEDFVANFGKTDPEEPS